MDELSSQIERDLREAAVESLRSRRPVLHHLNADTSWLLQIPRPKTAINRGGRYYFNVLVDPWLSGPQTDVASWFSKQWHASESRTGSIAAVEELLRSTEILVSSLRQESDRKSDAHHLNENREDTSYIDVVAISHEFTDHCHKDTLLEIHPDVPVFAAEKAASLIRSWSHFRHVMDVPRFTPQHTDWHATSIPPLPEWVGISRLVSARDALYFHSALMIAFNNGYRSGSAKDQHRQTNGYTTNGTKHDSKHIEGSDDSDSAEAVIYTPHGIHYESLALIPAASPRIHTLALLHGLHDISIDWGQQLNLGAHNGLKAQRLLNAKYWIGTHDEVKHGRGVVSWLLRRKVYSIGDALDKEKLAKTKNGSVSNSIRGDDKATAEILESFGETNWLHLGNGESRVLV